MVDKNNGGVGVHDEMCTFCEMAVVWVQTQIKKNQTEDNILNYVNEVKNKLKITFLPLLYYHRNTDLIIFFFF